MSDILKTALPCPHFGGKSLRITDWAGDDGEFEAVGCITCGAEAPAHIWNMRSGIVSRRRIEDLEAGVTKLKDDVCALQASQRVIGARTQHLVMLGAGVCEDEYGPQIVDIEALQRALEEARV